MANENKEKDSGMSAGSILKIGAGVAALAAATYYFFGPDGKSNRRHVRGWMIKMKGEIIEKIEDTKELTETTYHQIVDSVLANYLAAGKINKDDLVDFAEEIKGEWKNIIQSHVKEAKSELKKSAHKAAAKAKSEAKKK